jgi:RNA-dependent RNA polymerase
MMEVRPEGHFFQPETYMEKDMVMVYWEPSIVEKFKQPKVVDKPCGLEEKYFEEHVERVTSFHDRHAKSSPGEVQRSLLSAMLRSLDNANVGSYNKYHAYAVYTQGYSDPETIRLAYMYARFFSWSAESDVL